MKIIVLSGLDKSGKATQSNLLQQYLLQKGLKVAKSEFHRYDTPTGKLIMDWLTKKYDVEQETIELIMAADKQSQQQWFQQLENAGYDYLILDRYVLCQAAYGVANGMDGRWIVALQQYMRKPDIDIVVDIPAEVSMTRKGKHNNGNNDRYESDLEMLRTVRDLYRNMSNAYSAPIRRVVDGQRNIEEIHSDIVGIVKQFGGIDE